MKSRAYREMRQCKRERMRAFTERGRKGRAYRKRQESGWGREREIGRLTEERD